MDPLSHLITSNGGSLEEIFAAMDSDDLAQMVRAATKEFNKLPKEAQTHEKHPKSIEKSEEYRRSGNEYYVINMMRQAIEQYNKAIAFAPFPSVEFALALGNRSAALYSIKYYTGCVRDIDMCMSLKCPVNLLTKLQKRRQLAMLDIFSEGVVDGITSVPFTMTFLNFNCKKNPLVPCVSAQVTFTKDKRIEAREVIKPGTVVGIERAYIAFTEKNTYLTCYYCHRLDLRLLPCPGCAKALFCDEQCLRLCMEEYHCVECKILDNLMLLSEQLMWKTAIKLSLELGWDVFIAESRNIGSSRMKSANVKEVYDYREPLSILSYDDDKNLIEGRLFVNSLICSVILKLLDEVPDFFPEDKDMREAAWDAMARVMLHIGTFTNKVHFNCSAYDFHRDEGPFKIDVQKNYGLFSMCSKLKHSCEPNLLVLGLSGGVGLVSLRTIKKGEELTICYIDHFYDTRLRYEMKHERSIAILIATGRICNCRVCSQNWDSTTSVDVQMTKQQATLFEKVKVKTRSMDFKNYYDLCKVIDAFPSNSQQHQFAYETIRGMLKPVQCKYAQNKTYI